MNKQNKSSTLPFRRVHGKAGVKLISKLHHHTGRELPNSGTERQHREHKRIYFPFYEKMTIQEPGKSLKRSLQWMDANRNEPRHLCCCFARPHLYTWPRSAKGKLSSFRGPDGLSVSGVDSFHFLTALQMNVDVWGRISIFIQCMGMACLDVAASQKEPLLDHSPSSSKKKGWGL